MKKTYKNLLFIVAIVAVAVCLQLAFSQNRQSGAVAFVRIADEQEFEVSLNKDGVYEYTTETGSQLPFTLEVSEGKIRFINSQCPDHVCEGFGWLYREFDEAICLPARVVVSVENFS